MSNVSNMEDLLVVLLECGTLDLGILDDVDYDICEIVEEIQQQGLKPTLNMITSEIFRKGQEELTDAIKEAIEAREDEQYEIEDDDERYEKLQEEIDELESLNPEEDMQWFCNCLDTSCWLNNEEAYQKYLAGEIKDIEDNMGFCF